MKGRANQVLKNEGTGAFAFAPVWINLIVFNPARKLWQRDSTGAKLWQYLSARWKQCWDIQMYRHTDIEIYRYTYIQIYRHTDVQMCRCTDVQTYRHICICAILDQLDCFQPGSKTLAVRQDGRKALTLFKCQMETTFRFTGTQTLRSTDIHT